MREYSVRTNKCKCHPETCCCDDWAIYEMERKILTIYDKEVAEWVSSRLNFSEKSVMLFKQVLDAHKQSSVDWSVMKDIERLLSEVV